MTRLRTLVLLPLVLFPVCGLRAGPPEEGRSPVRVRVTDASTGQELPCRLTLVDAAGNPAAVEATPSPRAAFRPGVFYTGTGEARFTVPAGRYTLYATRGPEYGLVERRLEADGRPLNVRLKLEREVDTRGWVSCDTHVHTLTYSGHGDCTAEERMVTLAGEGIEVPVATEHNRHVAYEPTARATGMRSYFTPLVGNEVTTPAGHFNIFPVLPGSPPPDAKLTDWKAILAGVRAVPGVRVVVLNHLRDVHAGFRPADPRRFHPASGESLDGSPWSFDALELITSGAAQSDFMQTYRDWFALLNHGRPIVGVGSSDSHDVTRYLVGQGRTYVRSRAGRPDRVDVDEFCDNLLAGRALVSLGLFTSIRVDGRYTVGDLVPASGEDVQVRVRVQGPRWVEADRVELFLNGEKVMSRLLPPGRRAVVKADVTCTLPRPRHDAWLVAIASGPGITAPYWPLSRPYQPTRADWEPRVVGSTNPVRIDGDGDGRYSSPREYARAAVAGSAGSPERLAQRLAAFDSAVAVQAASLCRAEGMDLAAPAFRRALDRAAPQVRHGFAAYQNALGAVRD